MDASQFPSCFMPLCLLAVVEYLLGGRQRSSSSVLRKCAFVLGACSWLFSLYHRRQMSSFPGTSRTTLLPFLPDSSDPQRDTVATFLLEDLGFPGKRKSNSNSNSPLLDPGSILITGASRGIGRAFAVELARRFGKKRLILTSRNPSSLLPLKLELEIYYHVPEVVVIDEAIDLSLHGHAQRLFDITQQSFYHVDVLILNAGKGYNGNHADMTPADLSILLHLNMESNTILAALYAKEMMLASGNNSGGRILLMSSIVGTIQGMANAAMYAATKSYLQTLAWGLAGDLGPTVGVTVALPGATRETNFARSSNIAESAVWKYPMLVSTPQNVAYYGVQAMLRGEKEVFCGRFLDWFALRVIEPFLPPSFTSWFFGFSWEPWPFSFPPGWKPQHKNEKTNDEL